MQVVFGFLYTLDKCSAASVWAFPETLSWMIHGASYRGLVKSFYKENLSTVSSVDYPD